MKKFNFLFALFFATTNFLSAQQSDYKVVFDMSTRDSVSQAAVLREVALIIKENPAAKLEVVVYGQALNMLTRSKANHADDINRLTANPNISFKVCAFTMKRDNVTKADLLAGVEVVHDGIYEIISKQREGWGYIKVAH